jgi:hypothetical protein
MSTYNTDRGYEARPASVDVIDERRLWVGLYSLIPTS